MRRFYAERIDETTARLPEAESYHARTVLRMKPGDECAAIVGGALYAARLLPDLSTVALLSELPSPEPRTRVTLYQGLPKGEKMEFLAQKCTEAGIDRIVPVLFSRCVVKWDARDANKKTERWQRIALEAAKQCGRVRAPDIEPAITLNALCGRLPAHGRAFVPWEDARGLSLAAAAQGDARDIALIIGPEGGISETEIALLTAASAVPVTLGPRVFRTETAALAALVMVLTVKGEYE